MGAPSAIVPAFNRAGTIERALESALGQSEPPGEVLVVDDGSTDATRERVERFGERVRYLHQANAGASAARNLGAREARGEWIAFLDSDDAWEPDHLARIGRALRATGGRADLYFDDFRVTPEEGGGLLWSLAGFAVSGEHELTLDATEWAMLRIQPMMLQSSVFRRRAYLELGGLRPELRCRHDTHLFFLACLGRPACAVAGVGTVQSGDDRSGGRVTAAFGTGTRAYWQDTVAMYAELLAGARALAPRHRRELRRRLAAAHVRLARLAWREGTGPSLAHLASALRHGPGVVLGSLGRRASALARRA
jgi:glycosyltransferase involved in cell wall biosynthesis